MKKNGFTLVELLGVIVILIIIFLVIFPATRLIINRSEDTVYQTQINKILKASYDYSLNNVSVLPSRDQKNYITLAELIYGGYIDSLINPTTNEPFPDDYIVSIENVGTRYRNKEKNAIKYGDYLYKIEFDKMETTEYISNKPKIVIEGVEKTSKGYTTILDQRGTFIDISPKVYDNSDNEITSTVRIIKNIFFNNNLVSAVDTDLLGIYTVRYVAIYTDPNNKVYSSSEVWNVVISDRTAPTLTVPGNATISITDTTFDIMEGTSCQDNSGDCKITYTGSISFGVQGIYDIEYKATDASGNVSTIKHRNITVQ